MDNVQKPSNSECYTPFSESFSSYLISFYNLGSRFWNRKVEELSNKNLGQLSAPTLWLETCAEHRNGDFGQLAAQRDRELNDAVS
jgi:hypothetical protein